MKRAEEQQHIYRRGLEKNEQPLRHFVYPRFHERCRGQHGRQHEKVVHKMRHGFVAARKSEWEEKRRGWNEGVNFSPSLSRSKRGRSQKWNEAG